jgi:hypothetical protein
MTPSPAPFALRIAVPIYDGRDAHCGIRYHLSEMRYGTVAGVLAALFLIERDPDGSTFIEPWNAATGTKIPYVDLLRARGWNPPRRLGDNTKHGPDTICF